MKKLNNIALHLSLIKNIGPATVIKLAQALKSKNINLSEIYNLSYLDIINIANLSENIAKNIYNNLKDTKILEQELELINKYNISYLSLFCNNYPEQLKNIYLPPLVLYLRGDINILNNKAIAFVGARKADNYGLNMPDLLLPDLISRDYNIVSGGAIGIDTAVHRATLKYSGKTIAVLGSGLLNLYPSSNTNLFNKIIDNNGLVISPFSLKTTALPGNFPARNRIIAGLSKACIVVQAAKTSGALITAKFALEQGREVGAVPGNINNILSFGCNRLISQGAAIITSSQDILSLVQDTQEISNKLNLEQANIFRLNNIQDKILALCARPISIDELLIETELEYNKLQEYLLNLQLMGKINQDFMGNWHQL